MSLEVYQPKGGAGYCQLRVSRRAQLNLAISPSLERTSAPAYTAGPFQQYKVSAVGQMSLPVTARKRWGLTGGGVVEIADLEFGLLVLPERARRSLLGRILTRETLQAHIQSVKDDPDLGS